MSVLGVLLDFFHQHKKLNIILRHLVVPCKILRKTPTNPNGAVSATFYRSKETWTLTGTSLEIHEIHTYIHTNSLSATVSVRLALLE